MWFEEMEMGTGEFLWGWRQNYS